MHSCGLILAGGMGRRMQGQDKGWLILNSKSMISLIIDRLTPQVDQIIINANRNIDKYKDFDLEVIEDVIEGYQGPLAGILSGLRHSQSEFMVVVPCDCPFFPHDMVARLFNKQANTDADIVSVNDGERTHPVFALIKTSLHNSLSDYLQSGERKIDKWYGQHNYQCVNYPHGKGYFENINTPEQLQQVNQRFQENGN